MKAILLIAVTVAAPTFACPAAIDKLSGPASWYGPRHHGNLTASGKIFDRYGLTAAHPYLPFGTKVTVTARKTGRQVVVTITDRGPYIAGRVLDLSEGAAMALAIRDTGIACVSISYFKAPSTPGPRMQPLERPIAQAPLPALPVAELP
jgi:rare lipoprotein A